MPTNQLNPELIREALGTLAARRENESEPDTDKKVDAIGPVILEISFFLDPSRNPDIADAVKLLKETATQITLHKLPGKNTEWVWDGGGFYEIVRGRKTRISSRAAVEAFLACRAGNEDGTAARLPADFIPFLVGEINELATLVVKTGGGSRTDA